MHKTDKNHLDALCTAQLQLNFALTQKLQYFIEQVKMLFDKDFQRTFVQVNGTIRKNSKCISSNAPNKHSIKEHRYFELQTSVSSIESSK